MRTEQEYKNLEEAKDATIAQQAEEIERLKRELEVERSCRGADAIYADEQRETIRRRDAIIEQQAEENDSLKEVISLSEDSRLMDEYLKLERANARQAERIKANEQYEQATQAIAA